MLTELTRISVNESLQEKRKSKVATPRLTAYFCSSISNLQHYEYTQPEFEHPMSAMLWSTRV